MKQIALGTEKNDYDISSAVTFQLDSTTAYKTLAAAALVFLRLQVGNVTGTLAGGERIEVDVYVTPATGDRCLMTQFAMDVPAGQDFIIMQVPPFYSASGDKIEVEVVSNDAADTSVGGATWMFNMDSVDIYSINNVATRLDELMDAAGTDKVVNDSIIGKIASTDGDWSNFSKTTDSLQSNRDKLPTNLEDMSITDTTGIVQSNIIQIISKAAKDVLFPDSQIVISANSQMIIKEAGTATVIETKDIFKPNGDPVTTTSDKIAKEVQA